MTRVSIKTVAAAAGVSFQTASKVLNGKGSVSPATRARIIRVAAELGYVPNGIARGLVTRSTRTVGVIAARRTDQVLLQFVIGAEREARREGHCVIVGSLDDEGDGEGDSAEEYLRMLVERRVDGVLLAAPELEHASYVMPLLRGRPAVALQGIASGELPCAGTDQERVGALATEHLLALGRRRIATITGQPSRLAVWGRQRGYEQALRAAGLGLDVRLVEHADWEIEGGYRATLRLLERVPDLDAIFVHNDTMAVGVLSALHERGRRVPDDCAVIGCDDIPVAAHTIPRLSTVRIPFFDLGRAAMRLLLDAIAQPASDVQRVDLPVELVCRQTCGCGADGGHAAANGVLTRAPGALR